MNPSPKFNLYTDVICISERPEAAAIRGERVGVVDRSMDESGCWNYLVSAQKFSDPIKCLESELMAAEPIPLVSDDEHRLNIVAQTADLWYSVRWEGVRTLLLQRGHDPHQCLLIACEQGHDVVITLVLPDGSVVEADYREDCQTRQATQWVEWAPQQYTNREIELCREMLSSGMVEFKAEVFQYFNEHLRATDAPLPSCDDTN